MLDWYLASLGEGGRQLMRLKLMLQLRTERAHLRQRPPARRVDAFGGRVRGTKNRGRVPREAG